MNPSSLRVLLATETLQQATSFEYYLREAGHEVVAVEARGDVALKAARLIHPDLVVFGGLLHDTLGSLALATALRTNRPSPVPVLLVADPAELLRLLAMQAPLSSASALSPLSATPDGTSEAAGA